MSSTIKQKTKAQKRAEALRDNLRKRKQKLKSQRTAEANTQTDNTDKEQE